MYCICQIDKESNEEIVKMHILEDEFTNRIIKIIEYNANLRDIKYTILQNKNILNVEESLDIVDGYYLLENGKHIQLIKKYKQKISGYIYDSEESKVEILFTWKLIKHAQYNMYDSEKSKIESPFTWKLNKDAQYNHLDNNTIPLNTDNIIYEFPLEKMCKHPSILIIGGRGTGKSFLANHLMNALNALNALNTGDSFIKNSLIISPMDAHQNFYSTKFPEAEIIYDFDGEKILSYLTKETKDDKSITKQFPQVVSDLESDKNISDSPKVIECDKNISIPNRCFVLDCCYKEGWEKDKAPMELLFNARHYKASVILVMQTPFGLPPVVRLNFDYVFLLKDDSLINKRRLWDNYASVFPTIGAFEKVFDKCTENYGSMVIDNCRPSNSINEKIYWFKANDFSQEQ